MKTLTKLKKILLSDIIEDYDILEEKTIYHGSPHNFDNFSLEYMGTGEGNQSFGWGLYFAENKSVAKEYQKDLSKLVYEINNQEYVFKYGSSSNNMDMVVINTDTGEKIQDNTNPIWVIFYVISKGIYNKNNIKKYIRNDYYEYGKEYSTNITKRNDIIKKSIDIIQNSLKIYKRSNLYSIDIPDTVDIFNWDIKITEQNTNIQQKFNKIVNDIGSDIPIIIIDDILYIRSGEYTWLNINKNISNNIKKLNNNIKYLNFDIIATIIFENKGNKQKILNYIKNVFTSENNSGINSLLYYIIDYNSYENESKENTIKRMLGYFKEFLDTIDIKSINNKNILSLTGELFYNSLKGYTKDESGKSASLLLNKYNIKGHKYSDQGSRSNNKNITYNYVIYDDSIVKTINKEQKVFK
jgi:hypothetical protein